MRPRCLVVLSALALSALSLAMAGAADAPSLDAFFRPAPEVPATYVADQLYPRGRLLAFSFYSIRSVHDDWRREGITAIGPYYGPQQGHGQYAPYRSVIEAARELNGKPGLAKIFLFGEKRDDLKVQVTEGPDTQVVEYQKEEHVYPTVSHADLALGRERYLILVNSAPVPVTATITGFPVEKVRLENLFGGDSVEVTGGRGEGMRLEPYGVRAWRISRLAP